MESPLVSIIVPTFNRVDFIGEAIDSVFAQDYSNWELIIVDDGSTDDTKSQLSDYLKDPRVWYFYQENQGQSVARNKALEHANGELICFLDSDNRWLSHKLTSSIKVLEQNSDADILYADINSINEQGEVIEKSTMEHYSGRIAELLLKDNFVTMNTSMVKKHCFDEMGGFFKGRKAGDDYELWLKLAVKYTFIYLPDVVADYRIMDDQISSDKTRRFKSNEETILSVCNDYGHMMNKSKMKHGISFFYVRRGRWYSSEGKYLLMWKDFLIALKYDPFWQGPYRLLIRGLFQYLRPTTNKIS